MGCPRCKPQYRLIFFKFHGNFSLKLDLPKCRDFFPFLSSGGSKEVQWTRNPLLVQICSFSCIFIAKFCKIIGLCISFGSLCPPPRKSWIRHWSSSFFFNICKRINCLGYFTLLFIKIQIFIQSFQNLPDNY